MTPYLSPRSAAYMYAKARKKGNVKKYLSLYQTVSMPARFPDSGYYYQGKQRELTRIFETTISALPRRRQILVAYAVTGIDARSADYFTLPVFTDHRGKRWTAEELNNADLWY